MPLRFAPRFLLAMTQGLLTWSLAAASADPPESPPPDDGPPAIHFRDITRQAGVDFRSSFSPEKKYILESVSGGVALFDYNRDGLLDLYLVNSLTVEEARKAGARSPGALYRNDSPKPGDGALGKLRFSDQAAQAGLGETGWGVGVCVADVDGNGYPDLYVTGVGRNWLFLNRDGQRFVDATDAAGLRGDGWSTGCGFADPDRDGDLDLFVARYLDLRLDKLPEFGRGELCQYRGIPVQCGPRGLPGLGDLYFRNNGDGTFTEAGEAAGLSDPDKLFGLGVAWVDVDGDGWQDLFVANDTKANLLYLNRRDGTFEEEAFLFGAAVSEDGKEQGSMGIAVGDYLNQGHPSLFLTHFSEEYNTLYRNHGGDYFTDASFGARLAGVSLPYVGWGTAFADLDNDGWLDLTLVNGHVYPQIDDIDLEASAPYKQRRMLFHNLGNGRFRELRGIAPFESETVSRGLAVGDLDNDGRLDMVINDLDGKAQVLRNDSPGTGHWLLVELRGKSPNTGAIGARILLRQGERTLLRDVRSGTGYLSQDDLRVHFGLGTDPKIDALEVRWPDGSVSKHDKVAADQVLVIRQP